MGLLDSIGTVLERAVPSALAFVTGGPAAAVTTYAGIERAKSNQKKLERAEYMFQQDPGLSAGQVGYNPTTLTSPGFFAPGGALRQGVRDFGGFLGDFAPVASVFGLGNRFQDVPPAGAQTINSQAPAETSTSGEILGANLGVGTALVQGARNFARSPTGQGLIGGGLGFAGGLLSDSGGGMPLPKQ